MADERVNLLCLVKGNERYVWRYTDEMRAECLRRIGVFAAREDLSLTWYDAAVLSQRIRQAGIQEPSRRGR